MKAARQVGTVRVGISGWTYAGWRGVFFPKGLKHKDELSYAAGIFPSIEVNGTFYSLQRPESFARWADETPEDFVFAVKGPRFITHTKRLRDVETPLANFFASGLLRLGPKLGPLLWQLPPSFRFDRETLGRFLAMLPQDTKAAARLAGRHDFRLDGRNWLGTDAKRRLRHAIEIRHPSFVCRDFIELLRVHQVALVCADTVEWPRLFDVTADFVYCRLHGSEQLYASGYGPKALDSWADRVATWRSGGTPDEGGRVAPKAREIARDVYVYFDNDMKVRAPRDAKSLMERVGMRG